MLFNATQEDHESGLVKWARFFKASTWEELKYISEGNEVMQKTIVTLAQLSEDEKIREHCRLMEKYEHEVASAKGSAMRQGLQQGIQQGIINMIELCKELHLSEEDTLSQIASRFSLKEEEAQDYMRRYWQ